MQPMGTSAVTAPEKRHTHVKERGKCLPSCCTVVTMGVAGYQIISLGRKPHSRQWPLCRRQELVCLAQAFANK